MDCMLSALGCLGCCCCCCYTCMARQLRFVTNTTKESISRVVGTVQQLGFDIQEQEVRVLDMLQ